MLLDGWDTTMSRISTHADAAVRDGAAALRAQAFAAGDHVGFAGATKSRQLCRGPVDSFSANDARSLCEILFRYNHA
jgi:hypothetical protein